MSRDWKLWLWGASSAWCGVAVMDLAWGWAVFFALLSIVSICSAGTEKSQ